MSGDGTPEGTRFRDGLRCVHDFGDHVLVVCPRCSQCAEVLPPPGGAPGCFEARRLHCRSCGYVRDTDSECTTWGNPDRGRADDPYFGLPLWLQVECCGGRTLWAYNQDHLHYLAAFIAARVRERAHPPVPGRHHYRMTMVAKLPAWLTAAKHRDELSRKCAQLLSPIPEPVRAGAPTRSQSTISR